MDGHGRWKHDEKETGQRGDLRLAFLSFLVTTGEGEEFVVNVRHGWVAECLC